MGESAGGQSADADSARDPHDAGGALAADVSRRRRFEALALPHLDAAYNLARWLSRNAGDAEDIVQDAYLRAFRFFDSFRGDSARPWLLAIVRRVWYDEWRRRASAAETAEFDDARDDAPPDGWDTGGVDPETLAIRAQDAARVHDALERLPAEYREVMILREMEELSYREIAAIVDVPVGTVMSRLARGRSRLAALLGAERARAAGGAAAHGRATPQEAAGLAKIGSAACQCAAPGQGRGVPAAEGGCGRAAGFDGRDTGQRETRDEL
ncbi:RNA polymerase sigma factor [Paraburkholderia caballeronis]|uniref:RNA polymerase sigma factor n=1 Tax=Paraburkholderia caballeronis TaxID=416943 RepID=UPI0010647F24|nr:RNA polymerase sigma factor [Paraburkholderia caballeronis]TDV17171.1 RNA polymerase sigma-70 factor (ECF subfamily) [Paraburkholderia caballeronis]TDV17556.1 RNA polymerase sigma-70 factor (ECF subfamily) [Paraburkholderia caballeronis]TDV27574.1 RNA polymerase sigma-70 factor (ECF subfamily) [Paraburkholderia caballeronis]